MSSGRAGRVRASRCPGDEFGGIFADWRQQPEELVVGLAVDPVPLEQAIQVGAPGDDMALGELATTGRSATSASPALRTRAPLASLSAPGESVALQS